MKISQCSLATWLTTAPGCDTIMLYRYILIPKIKQRYSILLLNKNYFFNHRKMN